MAPIASTAPKFRHDLFDGAAHYFARYHPLNRTSLRPVLV